MIDFHAHVIPYIDDGAKDTDEAVEMLEILKSQGIRTVVATPHYYDNAMSIENFLGLRSDSFAGLMQKIKQENASVPEILLGAEVYLSYEIVNSDDIYKLCIGNTNCLLIEIPSGIWFERVLDIADYLIKEKNIRPVIAHFERYAVLCRDWERFGEIKERNLTVQVDADSFLDRKMKKITDLLVNNDIAHVIGSDAHDTVYRRPRLSEAQKKIEKRFGENKWNMLQKNAENLLSIY